MHSVPIDERKCLYFRGVIIELLNSISRDGPDMTINLFRWVLVLLKILNLSLSLCSVNLLHDVIVCGLLVGC